MESWKTRRNKGKRSCMILWRNHVTQQWDVDKEEPRKLQLCNEHCIDCITVADDAKFITPFTVFLAVVFFPLSFFVQAIHSFNILTISSAPLPSLFDASSIRRLQSVFLLCCRSFDAMSRMSLNFCCSGNVALHVTRNVVLRCCHCSSNVCHSPPRRVGFLFVQGYCCSWCCLLGRGPFL